MNILITGDKGFIGCNLIEKLKTCNAKLYGYDKVDSNSFINHEIPRFHHISPENLNLYKIDLIVHLAAYIDGSKSTEEITKCVSDNVVLTAHILDCMRRSNCKSIIFTSSIAAENPTNPYGNSKLWAENEIKSMFDRCDLDHASILRLQNVYGPYQSLKAFIPKYIDSYFNTIPFTITNGGSAERDFIHVDSVVGNILTDIFFYTKGTKHLYTEVIGSGKLISIDSVKKMIDTIFKFKYPKYSKPEIIYNNNFIELNKPNLVSSSFGIGLEIDKLEEVIDFYVREHEKFK